MSAKQFILVIYDISNDKRRTKLHNALLNYGTPVQYSAFECLLTKQEKDKMILEINKVIRPRKDRVRFYYLCATCLKKVHVTSGVELLSPNNDAMIIG
jgi:CRISPR-associated protein Cas2